MTLDKAAERLGIKPATIERWVKMGGSIPRFFARESNGKDGNIYRIYENDLVAFIITHARGGTPNTKSRNWLSLDQAAAQLEVDPNVLRRWIDNEKGPKALALRDGGNRFTFRIAQEDLDQFKEENSRGGRYDRDWMVNNLPPTLTNFVYTLVDRTARDIAGYLPLQIDDLKNNKAQQQERLRKLVAVVRKIGEQAGIDLLS